MFIYRLWCCRCYCYVTVNLSSSFVLWTENMRYTITVSTTAPVCAQMRARPRRAVRHVQVDVPAASFARRLVADALFLPKA